MPTPTRSQLLLQRFFKGAKYYAIGSINGSGKVKYEPEYSEPTQELVEAHLTGDITLGAYTLRPNSTVTHLVWDIDGTDRQQVRKLTLALSNFLGDVPHGIEFSGKKGYHVLIFFSTPVAAARAKNLGEAIRDAVKGTRSGDPSIEVFPKQEKLSKEDSVGNLLKLPLGLHPANQERSRFVDPAQGWEDGPALDPIPILSATIKLEELAARLVEQEEEQDPEQRLVDLLVPHWRSGHRHDLALCLAGYMAEYGWTETQVLNIVEKIHAEAGGDLNNQLDAVADTFEKHRQGEKILGLSGLVNHLPAGVLRSLSEIVQKDFDSPLLARIDYIRTSKNPAHVKVRIVTELVLDTLIDTGKLIQDTHTHDLFWLNYDSRSLLMLGSRSWETYLYNTFRLNSAETFSRQVINGIYHSAFELADSVRTYKRCHWTGDTLWLNLGGPHIYRIDGSESGSGNFQVFLNGEQGILFRNTNHGLHLELESLQENGVRPVNPWAYLIDDLNFGIGSSGTSPSQQKELIKAWFLSTFFAEAMPTRPLLTIVASAGAGKTSAARRFVRVLEGPHSDVSGIATDKPDALRAAIAANRVLVLDNLERSKAQWLTDLLNRVATGTQFDLRKLYTTNETDTVIPDCWIILTATALPFSEETLYTRLLPVELAQIRKPVAESVMRQRLDDNLPAIWLGIVDCLQSVVRELRANRSVPAPTAARMADFTTFCARIRGAECVEGDTLMKGLMTLTNRQQAILQESSPMVQVLDTWIRIHPQEAATWHSAGDLNVKLNMLAKKQHMEWRWDNGQALSQHIRALEPHLIRNFGMEMKEKTSNTPKKYRFSPEIAHAEDTDATINLARGYNQEDDTNGE